MTSYETITTPYVFALAPGAKRARNVAILPPKNARPFMRSNPLRFYNTAVDQANILDFAIPESTGVVINRVSLKCFPQFPGIGPFAYFTVLLNGAAIVDGAQQIFADATQVRQVYSYEPPTFQRVQWTGVGVGSVQLNFTIPPGNNNSFYIFAVMQGFTYPLPPVAAT